MKKFENKICLITGAGSGIGKAIATLFANEGGQIYISDVNDTKGKETVEGILATGGKADFVHLDVSKEEEWVNAIAEIEKKSRRLDVLINNAGIIGFERAEWGPQDPENASLESWKLIHAINADGTFLGCKHAISLMKKTSIEGHGASIVNMSSRSGMVGVPTAAAYASSKAAVRNHTKSVALYCASKNYNIRCNSLHPAAILTPMWDIMLGEGEAREKGIKDLSAGIPLGRLGTPGDIAEAALFLASDSSTYMTGSEVVLDGGIMAGTTTSPRKGE